MNLFTENNFDKYCQKYYFDILVVKSGFEFVQISTSANPLDECVIIQRQPQELINKGNILQFLEIEPHVLDKYR